MTEKDLYPAIERAFKGKGFVSLQQFSFDHPVMKGYAPKVDLVAFRWTSDFNIDVVAVEVKSGSDASSPLWATTQATTYQLLFPSVYIAAETPPEELHYSEGILRALGLGYINVSVKKAKFVFSPVLNARTYEMHFLESIRPVGVMALTADECLKEEWQSNASASSF